MIEERSNTNLAGARSGFGFATAGLAAVPEKLTGPRQCRPRPAAVVAPASANRLLGITKQADPNTL